MQIKHAFLVMTPILATGCGASDVRLQASAAPATTAAETLSIVRAAQGGAQVISLPVTRLTVEPVPAAPVATTPATPAPRTEATNAVVQQVTSTAGQRFRLTTTPTVSGDARDTFRVTARNDFTSRNALRISRFGDTDIPTKVENEFTDLTVLRIQQAGQISAAILSVVPALAGLAAAPTPPALAVPSSRCPSREPLRAFSVPVLAIDTGFQAVPGQAACFEYQVTAAGAGAADTVPRSMFRSLFIDTAENSRVWPVPACRDVTLTVRRIGGAEELTVNARIADPSLLRLMPLPDKGAITMHPVCNADVTNTPSDRWAAVTAAAEEAAKQIKAVAGAWPKE